MQKTNLPTFWNRMLMYGMIVIVVVGTVGFPRKAILSASVLPTLKISKPMTRKVCRQPVVELQEPDKQRLARICLALAILGQRR